VPSVKQAVLLAVSFKFVFDSSRYFARIAVISCLLKMGIAPLLTLTNCLSLRFNIFVIFSRNHYERCVNHHIAREISCGGAGEPAQEGDAGHGLIFRFVEGVDGFTRSGWGLCSRLSEQSSGRK
jgi:hypothetical protein